MGPFFKGLFYLYEQSYNQLPLPDTNYPYVNFK